MSQSSVMIPVAPQHGLRRRNSSSSDAHPRRMKLPRVEFNESHPRHVDGLTVSVFPSPRSPFLQACDPISHHLACGLRLQKCVAPRSLAPTDDVDSLPSTADFCTAQQAILSRGAPAQLKFVSDDAFIARLRAGLASDDRRDAAVTIVTLVAHNSATAELVAGMRDVIDALINIIVCVSTPPQGLPAGFPALSSSEPTPLDLLCPKCVPCVEAALYALYELCEASKSCVSDLSKHNALLKALTEYFVPKAEVASLWLLSTLVPQLPSEMRSDVCKRLLKQLSTTDGLQREAVLMAVRSCVGFDDCNDSLWETCVLGVSDILCKPDIPSTTKIGCLSLLKAVCGRGTAFQNVVADCPGLLTSVLLLAGDSDTAVCSQALLTLSSIISRNSSAQGAFTRANGVAAVAGRLSTEVNSTTGRNGQIVERALTVLIAAVVMHADNQRCVMVQPGLPKILVTLMDSALPRIRTLSAALIRSLVNRQPEFQPLFAALGALSRLLNMVAETDGVSVEQGVATLCQLVFKADLVQDFLLALSPLGALVAVAVNSKSSPSAAEYALLTLLMCVDRAPDVVLPQLRSFDALPSALLRLGHSSNPNKRCQATADHLLFKVDQELYSRRLLAASGVIVDQLPLVVATPDSPVGVDCAVCMIDVSESDSVWVPCFHRFHHSCLKSWFATGKDSCPLCKTSVCGSIHRSNLLE